MKPHRPSSAINPLPSVLYQSPSAITPKRQPGQVPGAPRPTGGPLGLIRPQAPTSRTVSPLPHREPAAGGAGGLAPEIPALATRTPFNPYSLPPSPTISSRLRSRGQLPFRVVREEKKEFKEIGVLGKRKRIESSERNERGGPSGLRNDAARSRSSGKSSARSRESSQKSLKSYSSSKERVKGKKERILESRNNSGERNISYVVQRSQSQEPPAVLTTFTNAMTETIPLLTSLTQLLEKKAVLESVDSIIIQGLMQTARRNVLRRR